VHSSKSADSAMERNGFRCGAVAIVGRPNVGKSTLLNALVGERVSITSDKPQTTRHRIRGILTTQRAQFVFVDTPGYQTRHRSALNRYMSRGVRQAVGDADCVMLVVEAGRFLPEDRRLAHLIGSAVPVVLAVNKIDRDQAPERLLPFLETVSREREFDDIVPVSARRGKGLKELLRVLQRHLPEREAQFAEDDFTDRSGRFLAAEAVREKLFRRLGDEIPYGACVTIDKFEESPRLRRIFASIVVEKQSHKAIVIGAGGEKLKRVASDARRDLERLFGGKVYLEVWVKVRGGWTDDEAALKRLGYE